MSHRPIRSCRWFRFLLSGTGVVVLFWAGLAHAILFKATGDPAYNTTPPGASLTNSGWQYEGQWMGFLGTPIAPRYFIAAVHIGGGVGNTMDFSGYTYHVAAVTNLPGTDLKICQVAETFPCYAPMYSGTNEVGKHCVAIGRGTDRGNPVVVSGLTNGWYWGPWNSIERWGENDIESVEPASASYSELLRATFDASGGSNECHLSPGDSSGGLFIQDSGVWKLAGIHYAVDGPFSFDGTTNTEFNAAMVELNDVFVQNGSTWQLVTTPTPSAFYSSRISSQLAAILSVIDFRPGPDLALTNIQTSGGNVLLSFATATNRLYRVEFASSLTAATWTTLSNNIPGTGSMVTVADPGALTNSSRRFYRLGLVQ
jgi:hypothetical protein